MEQDWLNPEIGDWVEEFAGKEFKEALAQAQIASLDEGGEIPEEVEEAPTERLQSVVERLERKGKASTPAQEAAAAPEQQEGEEAVTTKAPTIQPPQITEEHLRQWLGDEWDAMTEAQKKVAFLNYYNYVMLNGIVDAMKAMHEEFTKALEEFVATSEEDEAVNALVDELVEYGERAGLSEDELVEVAKMMEENQILNPRVAVEHYILKKRLASPVNVGQVRRTAAPAPQRSAQVTQPPQQPMPTVEEEVSGFADFVRKLPLTPEGRQIIRRII